MSKYRTAPDHDLVSWPKGVKYIVGNEGAERFSFYGMKAILWVYLAALFQQTGLAKEMADGHATEVVHLFMAATYALPVLGSVLADKLLGKYYTIMSLSLFYCLGHGALALFEGSVPGTYLGLALIAMGAGGIKPCVSAHVGDQFGKKNWHRIEKVFQIFYFMINFGSMFATLWIPVLKDRFGAGVAFAVPGILMAIATLVFWLGRNVFIHVPPTPGKRLGLLDTLSGACLFTPIMLLLFSDHLAWLTISLVSLVAVALGVTLFVVRQRIQQDDGFLAVVFHCFRSLLTGGKFEPVGDSKLARSRFWGPGVQRFGEEVTEGPRAVVRIAVMFFTVFVFWALFDQHASTWVKQAGAMNLTVDIPLLGTTTFLASQISFVNPALVMLFIPLLSFVVFPALRKRGIKVTPLRKMCVGMLLAPTAFVAVAMVQAKMDAAPAGTVSVVWQLVGYSLMTMAEVLVSITGLEFAYTQAPRRMKSIVMSFWMLTIAFGNWSVAKVENLTLKMNWSDEQFFWIFAGAMAVAAVVFTVQAQFYEYKEYPQ